MSLKETVEGPFFDQYIKSGEELEMLATAREANLGW